MKQYLVTMLILLAVALVAGVVVWIMYQDLNPTALQEESKDKPQEVVPEMNAPPEEMSVPGNESLTIPSESLTPTQRKMLEAFGVTGDFTVTPAMLSCAEEKIGTVRFNEILGGGAPTPREAFMLAPCLKAE